MAQQQEVNTTRRSILHTRTNTDELIGYIPSHYILIMKLLLCELRSCLFCQTFHPTFLSPKQERFACLAVISTYIQSRYFLFTKHSLLFRAFTGNNILSLINA